MLPELYHAHQGHNQEDLPFWQRLAETSAGPILELGCGTGRVLKPLAENGYSVVGLDNDFAMLEFCKARIRSLAQPSPRLLCSDLTHFHLSATFPLIILPCNTYSMLDASHRISCLECVSHHLSTNGIFAASLPNPEVLSRLPSHSEAQLEDEFLHPRTGNPVEVRSAWVRKRKLFEVTWTYDQLFPNGTVERHAVIVTQYLATLQTYLSELEVMGLRIKACYGDFDFSPYQNDSPQLILLAQHQDC